MVRIDGAKLAHTFRRSSTDEDGTGTNTTIEHASIHQKCAPQLTALSHKKKIDLTGIGSRPNTILLDFLKCYTKEHAKTTNIGAGAPVSSSSEGGGNSNKDNPDTCRSVEKAYTSCHLSVMGTGNYNGHKQCGDPLQEWLDCCLMTKKGRTPPR